MSSLVLNSSVAVLNSSVAVVAVLGEATGRKISSPWHFQHRNPPLIVNPTRAELRHVAHRVASLASLTPFLFLLLVSSLFLFVARCTLFFIILLILILLTTYMFCMNIFICLRNYLLWVYLDFGWARWWASCVCEYAWKRKRETFWSILVL